jgi:tRNA (cmo5U34)-methyltransferase
MNPTPDASPPIWDATNYDEPRRRLVPDFDLFYGTVAELVTAGVPSDARILDLGAGTGLVSTALRTALPAARLTLTDASRDMLDVARRRLDGGARFVVADLGEDLPQEDFDAVVSALAIHHLPDTAKADLFSRVLARLAPGGVFVNADQVDGPTPWHAEQYAAAHERDARRSGSDDAEWAGAIDRMRHDCCATLDAQLEWLRAAGFERVDVAFKRYRFAVYAGYTPIPTAATSSPQRGFPA